MKGVPYFSRSKTKLLWLLRLLWLLQYSRIPSYPQILKSTKVLDHPYLLQDTLAVSDKMSFIATQAYLWCGESISRVCGRLPSKAQNKAPMVAVTYASFKTIILSDRVWSQARGVRASSLEVAALPVWGWSKAILIMIQVFQRQRLDGSEWRVWHTSQGQHQISCCICGLCEYSRLLSYPLST